MEPGIGAEHREIIHLRMPGESAEARDDRIVSDLAVVPDVRAVHQVVVVSDTRTAASPGRADVNRDVFPNLGSLTDFEAGGLAVEPSILGLRPKAGMREDSTIRSDSRPAEKRGMRTDFDSRTDLHLASYKGEGTHHDIGRQDRSVFDAGRRVDIQQGLSPFR